ALRAWGWDGGVAIPVGSLQEPVVPVIDPLDGPVGSLDVELARSPHSHASLVHAGLLAGGDRHADVVAGLEAMHALTAREVPAREAVPGQASPLIGTAPGGADGESGDPPAVQGAESPDACRIERVRLRDAAPGAVELGAATAGGLDR